MAFHFENLGMLVGLVALAVPIVLHLVQRRHYDTLDWGAMQFLPESSAAQRRRWLDEILLMLMRMAMIALIVIALATPVSTSAWVVPLGDRSSRDIVVILDGSYSMDVRIPGQPTPWSDAVRWTRDAPGSDRFTFLLAGPQPVFVQQDELVAMTARSNPNMPRALREAWRHLRRSTAATKQIIVLTDGQRHGWADADTLSALDDLGSQWHADMKQMRDDGVAIPSLCVVKVGNELPKSLPNYALAPLTTPRRIVKVGHKSSFQSALWLQGFPKYAPPRSVKVLIDGKEIERLSLPTDTELKDGQIPLSFHHRFVKEGRHVVTLVLDADPLNDVLPADNEQQVVVEVVKEVPVLIVDGDAELSPESSGFFLQRALGSKPAVPFVTLKPSAILLASGVQPVVIVLADVPRLERSQRDAIERFLVEGGGLLIFAGERVAGARAFYNEQLYRGGQGWLPAALGEIASSKAGMPPAPGKFQHPALELFRAAPDNVMSQVRFPKWWKVKLGSKDRNTAVATLINGDPWLLEKPYKQGRVILCTVPPDRRWDSTLPNAVEFPILIHELAYYLAGNRTVAEMRVPLDLRESDLTRCTDNDWRKVRDRLPVAWQKEAAETSALTTDEGRRVEIWWLVLIAVLALLCTEVWMTRRMALARG